MPSPVAAFLTLCFVAFLFRRDFREKPNVTRALWLPFFWVLILYTRSVSEWLEIFGFHIGAPGSLEEGSPVDATVFMLLIACAIYVLNKRHARLAYIIRANPWITLFLLYCLVSVLWSDFPFISFKRWIKVLGHPLMVFVLLTEPDFEQAVDRLIKRCAYIIGPVSILFIKYYPQWGRVFDPWTGVGNDTGITTDKNILGCVCLTFSFYFFWRALQVRRRQRSRSKRNELILTCGLTLMFLWLLKIAHSATSTVSLLLAVMVVLLLGLRALNKKLIGMYVVAVVIAITLAQYAFDLFTLFLHTLSKDPTLTGRADLWEALLRFPINRAVGTGFESFWLGPRREAMDRLYWWHPTEAHNGYLETYLTLGVVGLLILVGLLLATFRKCKAELFRDFEWGRFRLGFLAAVIVYNWTESSFKALHPVWFMFYVIALDYPRRRAVKVLPVTVSVAEQPLVFSSAGRGL